MAMGMVLDFCTFTKAMPHKPKSTKAPFESHKRTGEENDENNNNELSLINDKIKPYNVVDLTTHHRLTEEEVYKCLKEAVEKESRKKNGVYYGYERAKPNGDAPNFITLPPKQRSKSVSSLQACLINTDQDNNNNGEVFYDDPMSGGRVRCYTAPASAKDLLKRSDTLTRSSISKASRLTSPSSPGSTKRKVQQKLQREGKQLPSPRMSASSKGSPSPLLKHYSGSRIPGGKPGGGIPTPSSFGANNTKSEQKETGLPGPRKIEQKSHTPDPQIRSTNRTIAQTNYRSNLSRLSNKNSDGASECSSDSGSCRSTPVYGSQSPLEKKAISPPIGSSIPPPLMRPSTGVPAKRTPSFADRKQYSSNTLPIRKERTFDCSKERKTSSPIMGAHARMKGSCENISKSPKSLSGSTNTLERTATIPRSKQSSECLPAYLGDENTLSSKQHYESSSSIASSSRRSSIESSASDSSDISKLPKIERYSKLPSAAISSGEKKPVARGIPAPSKRSTVESPTLKPKSSPSLKPKESPSLKPKESPSLKPKQSPSLKPKESPSLKSKFGQPSTGIKPTSRMKPPSAASTKKTVPDSQTSVPRSAASEVATEKNDSTNKSTEKNTVAETTIPTTSALRTPGSLAADKKKKTIESPLTKQRNKLAYSGGNSSAEKPEIIPRPKTSTTTEPSKLRQPGSASSSPALTRSSKFGRPQGFIGASNTPPAAPAAKSQASLRFTPTPLANTGVHTNNLNSSQEIDFKKEPVEIETITIDDNSKADDKEDDSSCSEIIDSNVGNNITKQIGNLRIYQEEQNPRDSRDAESMNSSRSSEMDDGYSSLHKLDNLSPTLGEDIGKPRTSSAATDEIIKNTDLNKNIIDSKNRDSISSFDDKTGKKHVDELNTKNSIKRNETDWSAGGPPSRDQKVEDRYGYADPEDSIQRTSTDLSDYKVPVDCKLFGDSDTLERRSSVDEQFPISPKHTYRADVIQKAQDPFTKAFEDAPPIEKSTGGSPFKRIHPKVIVPPPTISSICKNGELAPVPSEYSRTPSSDGDELTFNMRHNSTDLRRRAREQAKKVWTKTAALSSHDFDDDDMDKCVEDFKTRECLESDIFYSSKDIEKTSMDVSSKFATRTSVRSFDTPPNISSDTPNYRFDSITSTSDPEKKKKSKIKKFFKKLSTTNKKDGKPEFDARLFPEHCQGTSGESYSPHLQYRRTSEGVESVHSIHDIHEVSPPPETTPPISKRRMFNFSFKKKGRRNRSNTDSHSVFTEDGSCVERLPPELSNTVRALCSPDLSRRSEYMPVRGHDRRGSDPSLYHFNRSLSPNKKKYRAPDPPPSATEAYAGHRDSDCVVRNMSSSSGFSTDDVADYANYPFSKVNIKAPMKPQRLTKGSSNSDRCSNHSGGSSSHDNNQRGVNFNDALSTSSSEHLKTDNNNKRRSGSQSSDSSIMSMESTNFMCPPGKGQPFDNVSTRSTGSLRRTPLRHSVDNFNKLLEVHKQTIDKIAFEISTLRCECEILHELEWDDFERKEDMIQLGLNSYMVVPVSCTKVADKRRFYAWLRLSQQHSPQSDYPVFDFSKSTLHRNCIHACHIMQQNYSAPFQDGIPKSIQIDGVYISTQCPKMTLSKYISLTLEKHGRYPEIYEREVAMIMLQVVKGIQMLHSNDARVSSIESDNVFILNNGEPSVVLSPRREPNRCPAVAVAVLPGLGDCFQKTETDAVTSICHQLAFLLFELLHSPYQDELSDAVDMSMLVATLPDLTIKSIYSRYLQYVINVLLGTSSHTAKSLDDLQLILEIILFGPSDLSDHSEEETVVLINKWHNRRCVDMVTHILKEAPLIMLCASGPSAQDIDKIKNVDQEILLECEFLSYVSAADIYRVSKMLNR